MKSLFSSTSGDSYRSVLGVHVTRGEVRAVLVREVEDGDVVLVDRFHRYRGDGAETESKSSSEAGAPIDDPTGVSETDYTIEFGSEGGGGSAPGEEFGGSSGLPGDDGGSPGELEAGAHLDTEQTRPPFADDLAEIVAECTEKHGRPSAIVFVGEAWNTQTRTLRADSSPEETEALQDLLHEQLLAGSDTEISSERVAFQPLADAQEESGFLALVRRADDATVQTIEKIRDGHTGIPDAEALLGETTLFAKLFERGKLVPSKGTQMAVRIGSDDTFVLFFEDGALIEQKLLKSLSVHDPPDTVAKRVLLHQDKAGTKEPARIWVLAEEREEAFVDRFTALNTDVSVHSLFETVSASFDSAPSEGGSDPQTRFGLAQATALETLHAGEIDEDLNLLPAELRKRRSPVRWGWHTFAAAALLFAVSLFLTLEYQSKQTRVQELRTQIEQYPPGLESRTEHLESEIDSLRGVYTRYEQALGTLDSLLVDSDRWSRMLARIVRMQDRTPGVWFESWRPHSAERVKLKGFATERDRVVKIADRLNASVQRISSEKIRSYPVYRFTMSAPLPGGLPEAVRYLRKRNSVPTDTTRLAATNS